MVSAALLSAQFFVSNMPLIVAGSLVDGSLGAGSFVAGGLGAEKAAWSFFFFRRFDVYEESLSLLTSFGESEICTMTMLPSSLMDQRHLLHERLFERGDMLCSVDEAPVGG